MKKYELAIIIYIITILLSVMYATQPLQPLLANEFHVSVSKASFFTAVIMFFLAISPIFYGYILEHVNSKKVLYVSMFLLLVTNIILSFASTYEQFLTIRILEAIFIPAILTACMSILASQKNQIKKNMSLYVASTIFGGLIGRIMSGFIATIFSWQFVFMSLSCALLLCIYLLKFLSHDAIAKPTQGTIKDFIILLSDRRLIIIYILMFISFFVFAGILNTLPFKMKDENPDITETQIGLLYSGYGIGIIISLFAQKIVIVFKKELRTIIFGLIIFFIATLLLLINHHIVIYLVMFLFCMGMFIVHVLCARISNSLNESKKSLTSGMYLSFYYLGGATGSIVPPLIYSKFGWDIMIGLCLFLIIISILLVQNNKKIFKIN